MTPNDLAFQRLPTVLARRGKSRSAHYLDCQKGLFPPPVQLGPRFAAYPLHEVNALLAAEISGASVEQRRALVRQLLEQRRDLMPALPPAPAPAADQRAA